MYIAGKTEDGDVLVWTGYSWSDDASDAESYGEFAGSYEMGKLKADYLEPPYYTYNGTRIVEIYKIS